MYKPSTRWLQVCFINLMLVALIGIILRYKIAYSLPFVNQKFLLHAHSHFAFAGWLSQVLMVLMIAWLRATGVGESFKTYRVILYANLLTAYGMLLSFSLQGYGFFSIVFSILSIVVSYLFAMRFWKDLNGLPQATVTHKWFKAALFFNVLSSLGVFTLAFMMATKNILQDVYVGAVYFYLHFQYNGWFFFACMGLLSAQLAGCGVVDKKQLWAYRLFATACVPACLLSLLWFNMPFWVYILVALAALMQVTGWIVIVQLVRNGTAAIKQKIPMSSQRLFLLSAIALTIKLCLQAISVIPDVSKIAFGFRPIVIGYLHLVLLGVLTIFIIGYCVGQRYIKINATVMNGIGLFVVGILLNETLLMIQGIADLNYNGIPFLNVLLLAAAILLFTGISIVNYGMRDKAMNE